MSTIVFSAVTVDYGSGPVVDDVTLAAVPGEWVAVVGPNGAGKSSLLGTVFAGRPTSGRITIDEIDVEGLSSRERSRLVGYVPQRPIYPPGLSVFDYVLLGRTPHMSSLASEGRADIDSVWEALEALSIEEFATRDVSTLSGGETQRVSLARVVAQSAPILILDEATASLDLSAQHEVLELIDSLRESRGLTIISAIHDLTAAGQFAHNIALLDGGSLVAFGLPGDVLNESLLRSVFEGSVRVVDVGGDPVVVSVRTKENA